MTVLWLAHRFLMTCGLSSFDSGQNRPMVYQSTYGLSTDIEKAFLHVGLNEGDRDFTRFLWLSDPTNLESKFEVYRFKTVLFGSTSSPFTLNATSHCHLRNHNSPIAKDIKDNVHVDNIISGCDHQPEIVQYYSEARSITAACLNLRSWA